MKLRNVQVHLCWLIVFFGSGIFLGTHFIIEDVSGETSYDIPFIDTHMHLMIARQNNGALQKQNIQKSRISPRNRPLRRQRRPLHQRNTKHTISLKNFKNDYRAAADNLVQLMDAYGVQTVLLLPPPQTTGQKGVKNGFQENLIAVQAHPDRLALVAGGSILNPIIHEINAADVSQEDKTRFRMEAEQLVELGIKGFGEMSVLHLAMQERHNYSQAPADHPLFLLLADIAAMHDIPIDIHMEAVPELIQTPKALSHVSHNPENIPATIPGLERLLQYNREAKIVWQHIGWDNTGYMTPKLLSRLLEDHPNLYLALRVEELSPARSFVPNRIVGENNVIRTEWLKFITQYASRIMIGSDEFIGVPGVTRRMPQSFRKTWEMLKQFSPDVAYLIGSQNALRIYNLGS